MNSSFPPIIGAVSLTMTAFAVLTPLAALAERARAVEPIETASLAEISLPAPDRSGGRTIGQALADRRSCRSYARKSLDRQTLSDLLWAAGGINRADGHRTAPSAYGKQSVEIYAVLDEGVYRYQPQRNVLVPLVAGSFHKASGLQPFVETAPLNLLFVADFSKLPVPDEEKDFLIGVDAGTMSQNVSLFCSSRGLGTVVRAAIDGDAFGKLLGLPEQKRIVLAQTIGWPLQ